MLSKTTRRNAFVNHLTVLLALVMLLCSSISNVQAAKHVGKDACVKCHAEQVKLWKGLHHDLAMQHANDETVLADFSSTEFEYAGITSRFYKKTTD